jgi:hypothetical protein
MDVEDSLMVDIRGVVHGDQSGSEGLALLAAAWVVGWCIALLWTGQKKNENLMNGDSQRHWFALTLSAFVRRTVQRTSGCGCDGPTFWSLAEGRHYDKDYILRRSRVPAISAPTSIPASTT